MIGTMLSCATASGRATGHVSIYCRIARVVAWEEDCCALWNHSGWQTMRPEWTMRDFSNVVWRYPKMRRQLDRLSRNKSRLVCV